MTESLISERGGGRRLLRKEIEAKHIEKLANFLRMSFHWPALLCFSGSCLPVQLKSPLFFRLNCLFFFRNFVRML